jgi:hypothetical protein
MDPLRGPNNKIKVLIPECLEKDAKRTGLGDFFDLGPTIFPGVLT